MLSHFSRVQLFATLWTVAYQAPQSMEFFRQEYWSELPFPSPGDLLDPGIEPRSPALQADALPSEPPGKPSSSPRAADLSKILLQTCRIMIEPQCKSKHSPTVRKQIEINKIRLK